MREQTKEKKRAKPTRAVSLGALTTCFCHLNPLYYSVVSDAQCERPRKRERKKESGPHSARGSAEPYVSVSLPNPFPFPIPFLESSSSNPSINYLRQRDSTPHHSIAILEKKPKLDSLTRYQKRTVLFFFFLQNLKLVLHGSLRIHATDVVLHVMQVLPPLLQYYSTTHYSSTIRSGRYLLVGKVVQFDLTHNLPSCQDTLSFL